MHVKSGACGDGKGSFSRVLKFVNARLKDLGVGELLFSGGRNLVTRTYIMVVLNLIQKEYKKKL